MQAVQKFGIPRREARTVETATINYVYGCSVRPVEGLGATDFGGVGLCRTRDEARAKQVGGITGLPNGLGLTAVTAANSVTGAQTLAIATTTEIQGWLKLAGVNSEHQTMQARGGPIEEPPAGETVLKIVYHVSDDAFENASFADAIAALAQNQTAATSNAIAAIEAMTKVDEKISNLTPQDLSNHFRDALLDAGKRTLSDVGSVRVLARPWHHLRLAGERVLVPQWRPRSYQPLSLLQIDSRVNRGAEGGIKKRTTSAKKVIAEKVHAARGRAGSKKRKRKTRHAESSSTKKHVEVRRTPSATPGELRPASGGATTFLQLVAGSSVRNQQEKAVVSGEKSAASKNATSNATAFPTRGSPPGFNTTLATRLRCAPGRAPKAVSVNSSSNASSEVDASTTDANATAPTPTSYECTACPIGYYSKFGIECVPCPMSMTTEIVGASEINACVLECPTGFGREGASCRECREREFVGWSSKKCEPCPSGMKRRETNATAFVLLTHLRRGTRRRAADDEELRAELIESTKEEWRMNCVPSCPPGQGFVNSKCEVCPLGTFQTEKPDDGTVFPSSSVPTTIIPTCELCPTEMTTLRRGSTLKTACVPACGAGQSWDGTVCQTCAADTFSTVEFWKNVLPAPNKSEMLDYTNGTKNALTCEPCAAPFLAPPGAKSDDYCAKAGAQKLEVTLRGLPDANVLNDQKEAIVAALKAENLFGVAADSAAVVALTVEGPGIVATTSTTVATSVASASTTAAPVLLQDEQRAGAGEAVEPSSSPTGGGAWSLLGAGYDADDPLVADQNVPGGFFSAWTSFLQTGGFSSTTGAIKPTAAASASASRRRAASDLPERKIALVAEEQRTLRRLSTSTQGRASAPEDTTLVFEISNITAPPTGYEVTPTATAADGSVLKPPAELLLEKVLPALLDEPALLEAITVAQVAHTCDPGYGQSLANSMCVICAPGFFSPGGVNPDVCQACPSGKTSIAAAETEAQCYGACEPGTGVDFLTEGRRARLCVGCGENFYSEGGNNACFPCPTGMTSPEGSGSLRDCSAACPPGFGISGVECLPCPKGTFSAGGAAAFCEPCPAGTTTELTIVSSSQGAVSAAECGKCGPEFCNHRGNSTGNMWNFDTGGCNCQCERGYSDVTNCAGCVAGYEKDERGNCRLSKYRCDPVHDCFGRGVPAVSWAPVELVEKFEADGLVTPLESCEKCRISPYLNVYENCETCVVPQLDRSNNCNACLNGPEYDPAYNCTVCKLGAINCTNLHRDFKVLWFYMGDPLKRDLDFDIVYPVDLSLSVEESTKQLPPVVVKPGKAGPDMKVAVAAKKFKPQKLSVFRQKRKLKMTVEPFGVNTEMKLDVTAKEFLGQKMEFSVKFPTTTTTTSSTAFTTTLSFKVSGVDKKFSFSVAPPKPFPNETDWARRNQSTPITLAGSIPSPTGCRAGYEKISTAEACEKAAFSLPTCALPDIDPRLKPNRNENLLNAKCEAQCEPNSKDCELLPHMKPHFPFVIHKEKLIQRGCYISVEDEEVVFNDNDIDSAALPLREYYHMLCAKERFEYGVPRTPAVSYRVQLDVDVQLKIPDGISCQSITEVLQSPEGFLNSFEQDVKKYANVKPQGKVELRGLTCPGISKEKENLKNEGEIVLQTLKRQREQAERMRRTRSGGDVENYGGVASSTTSTEVDEQLWSAPAPPPGANLLIAETRTFAAANRVREMTPAEETEEDTPMHWQILITTYDLEVDVKDGDDLLLVQKLGTGVKDALYMSKQLVALGLFVAEVESIKGRIISVDKLPGEPYSSGVHFPAPGLMGELRLRVFHDDLWVLRNRLLLWAFGQVLTESFGIANVTVVRIDTGATSTPAIDCRQFRSKMKIVLRHRLSRRRL
eukprot:g19181.t1